MIGRAIRFDPVFVGGAGVNVSLPQFEISILTGDGVVFVELRVPALARQSDIESVIVKLVEAFATVERRDEEEMQSVLFDGGSQSPGDEPLEFIFRREYSDPQYPVKLDCALRRLTSGAPTLH